MYGRIETPYFVPPEYGGGFIGGGHSSGSGNVFDGGYGGGGGGDFMIIDEVFYPIDYNDNQINPNLVLQPPIRIDNTCKCVGEMLHRANGDCYCKDIGGSVNTQVAANPLGNITDIIKQNPLVAAGIAGLIVYAIFGK